MCRPAGFFAANFLPGSRINTVRNLLHANAAVHRAHADAEITADAFLVDDLKFSLAIYRIGDGLVCRILADYMAATALDAQILIDEGLLDVIEIQILPVRHAGNGLAHEVGYGTHAFVVEKVAEAVREVVDDLEAVDHGPSSSLPTPT